MKLITASEIYQTERGLKEVGEALRKKGFNIPGDLDRGPSLVYLIYNEKGSNVEGISGELGVARDDNYKPIRGTRITVHKLPENSRLKEFARAFGRSE